MPVCCERAVKLSFRYELNNNTTILYFYFIFGALELVITGLTLIHFELFTYVQQNQKSGLIFFLILYCK